MASQKPGCYHPGGGQVVEEDRSRQTHTLMDGPVLGSKDEPSRLSHRKQMLKVHDCHTPYEESRCLIVLATAAVRKALLMTSLASWSVHPGCSHMQSIHVQALSQNARESKSGSQIALMLLSTTLTSDHFQCRRFLRFARKQ